MWLLHLSVLVSKKSHLLQCRCAKAIKNDPLGSLAGRSLNLISIPV